jgi:hypothetical protein
MSTRAWRLAPTFGEALSQNECRDFDLVAPGQTGRGALNLVPALAIIFVAVLNRTLGQSRG